MTKTIITTLRKLYEYEAIRFIFVGGVSFLIEFGLFVFLIDVADIKYTNANLPAMGVAILANYFLIRWLVFEPGRYSGKITFLLFIAFTMVGIALNQFLLWFFVEQLFVNIKVSKVFSILLVAVFNFFTKKHIVF